MKKLINKVKCPYVETQQLIWQIVTTGTIVLLIMFIGMLIYELKLFRITLETLICLQ